MPKNESIRIWPIAAIMGIVLSLAVGVSISSRYFLLRSANPFAQARLAPGMTRADLVAVLGEPQGIKSTDDDSYQRLRYELGDYSIELVLFNDRLETWNELGPSRVRGQSTAGGCCK